MEEQMKIGIDIGGSHVGIGLVDEFGNIQQKKEKYIVEKVENESQISKQNLKEEITQFIIQTIKEYQKMDFVESVGIAVPGTVNLLNIKDSYETPEEETVTVPAEELSKALEAEEQNLKEKAAEAAPQAEVKAEDAPTDDFDTDDLSAAIDAELALQKE